ncbi:MAG: hypothetical protein J6V33_08725, partial [Bacteroidales bacterium]|nr:hypothetical protein [Bacteroidales bacterium]
MKKVFLLILLLYDTIVGAQNIYTPMKEFLFEVQTTVGNEKEVQYISMWATDKPWEADSSQHELFYAYNGHCSSDYLAAQWPYADDVEATGMIETDGYVWLHPPRWRKLSVLEYFPFPELTKDIVSESKYTRMFIGSVDFLDKWMFLRYKMEVEKIENKIIIHGKAKTRRGEWTEVITYDSE